MVPFNEGHLEGALSLVDDRQVLSVVFHNLHSSVCLHMLLGFKIRSTSKAICHSAVTEKEKDKRSMDALLSSKQVSVN